MLAGMKNIATAIALTGTITLVGCATDTETETTHYDTVADLATNLECKDTDLGDTSGWCTIDGKDHLIGITDDPPKYAGTYLESAPDETVGTGANWYMVCGLMDAGECGELVEPAGGQVS